MIESPKSGGFEIPKSNVSDEMIENVLDDQTLGESKRDAEERRSKLSKEEFHRLRVLCKRDLFFLTNTILGYNRLSTKLHGHLCTHVHNTQNSRFREFLMPRGHFKSTILTIAHSIQIVLPYTETDKSYDDGSTLEWPYTLGPDCRVLIAHETHESACRFLFSIIQHFTSNSLLISLFPDAIPDKRKHRVNKRELELPRSSQGLGTPEPTVDTFGVGGKSQGRHYNFIKLDDIFGEQARDSAAEAETTRDWFDGIQSFFSTFLKDHFDLIGTRYSLDDIYEHAHSRYEGQLVKYCRRVEETVYDKDGLPLVDEVGKPKKVAIFPEEFTPETLTVLRRNRKRFSAEYENDPDDGVSGFSDDWKRYFYWTAHNEIAVFGGDQTTKLNVRDLDVVILIDPGHTTGGFAVTGMDYLGRVFILVAVNLNLKPPDLTEMVFRNVMRWQPRTVAIESDLFAGVYQYWWASEMSRRGVRFNVTPVFTQNRTKDDRIMGLSHYMVADKFYINETQSELIEEWRKVGKTRDVHIFDAIAYGPEVWRLGYSPGQRSILETPVETQDISDRDPWTGYSKITYGEDDSKEITEVSGSYAI